jgi:hypothetical protein
VSLRVKTSPRPAVAIEVLASLPPTSDAAATAAVDQVKTKAAAARSKARRMRRGAASRARESRRKTPSCVASRKGVAQRAATVSCLRD